MGRIPPSPQIGSESIVVPGLFRTLRQAGVGKVKFLPAIRLGPGICWVGTKIVVNEGVKLTK
jgi:hypothetical protein